MKKKWDNPYYRYQITKRKLRVTIDVTGSIPNFEVQAPGVSDVAAEFEKRKLVNILDFGAGKLRNSLYLLNRNFRVWAVEFREAFDRQVAQQRLTQAQAMAKRALGKKFFYLEYPKDFLSFKKTLDAGLLINVVNVVPEQADRKMIIRECAKRIKKGGLLFVMTQYGEPHYRPGVTKRLSLKDGWCYGLHKKYQTFNREFSIPELKALVPKSLFTEVRKIAAPHHRAFLFERT